MTNVPELRQAIIKLLDEFALNSSWLPDEFYDKLVALITEEKKKAVEEALWKAHEMEVMRSDDVKEVLSEMFP